MTLSPEAVAVLNEAERLLIEKGWTQKAGAHDAHGNSVSIGSPDAACFCLYGAIGAAIGGKRPQEDPRMNEACDALDWELRGLGYSYSFISWNDAPHRTKEEVLALIRRVKGDAS